MTARFFSRHYDTISLVLALLAGGLFLFSNLHGVIYLAEDEARPFTLLSSGQLMFFLGHPVYERFHTQASVFYLAAFLNFASIPLFYMICRAAFGRGAAAFSVLFYAAYPFRVDYARMLFPASFMEPFFLLAILFCYWGLSRRESWWMTGAGASLALAFFVHYMAYVMIAGMGLAVLYFRRPFIFILKMVFGFLAAFFLAVKILSVKYRYDFYHYFWDFFHGTKEFKNNFRFEEFKYLLHVFSWAKASVFHLSLTAAVLASISFMVFLFFKKRDAAKGFFLITYSAGAGMLFLMSCLGRNPVYDRHFVWLVSFYCLSLGVTATAWVESSSGIRRRLVIVLFLSAVGACAWESGGIVRETFSIDPITAWLKVNQIEKKSILTTWKIAEPGDLGRPSLVPSYVPDRFRTDPMWYVHESLKIAWPAVYRAYRMGLCQYLLTSGIDDMKVGLGQNDFVLQNVQPIASWPHPYSVFSKRGFYSPGTSWNISLYRLSDVFSRENSIRIKLLKE